MSYVRTLTICLVLVYFVSAAGCHCFDLVHALMPCYLACICHSTCALYLLHTHIQFMLIVWFVFVMQFLHVNSFLLVIHWCLSINLCNSCSSSCFGWSFSPGLLCGLYSLCLICAHCAVCDCLAIHSSLLALF